MSLDAVQAVQVHSWNMFSFIAKQTFKQKFAGLLKSDLNESVTFLHKMC
jgi:hypothetical protein